MKKLSVEGKYFSTYAFVQQNKLEKIATKVLGKGWEAEDDVNQIECIIEALKIGKHLVQCTNNSEDIVVTDISMYTTEKQFPNGFTSWQETHFEIVQAITIEWKKDAPQGKVKDRQEAQGHGGLYELAEELTDLFEWRYKDTEWGIELEFFDEIESFIKLYLY